MSENKERNLTVIENTGTDKETETKSEQKSLRHTNPIVGKMVEFHHEKVKFSVKDIFKK